MRIRTMLLAVSLAVAAPSAWGQPTITGVTGTLTNGQTVTITGSGFGTKSPAAPAVFEDFSDGTANGINKHGGAWHITNNADNLRTSFHVMNARCDFKNAGGNCDYDYSATTASRWFVQYWVKLAPNWQWGTTTYGGSNDGLANVKYWRVFPTGARNYSNVGYAWHGFNGNKTSRFVENGESTTLTTANSTLLTIGGWNLIQVAYAENSGVDQADGQLRLWINGAQRDSTNTLVTNVGSDGSAVNKRPFIIGLYDSWPPSDAAVDHMYGYYADIYVDTSWARVEVGDSSVYGNCTVREIQIPSAWSPTSVTVTFKQGVFTNGQLVYVFVVHENGDVSPGFGIVIGSSGGQDPPPTPRHRWRQRG